MIQTKGQNLLTITVSGDEIYEIKYNSGCTMNIINNTDGTLIVAEHRDYADDGVAANCLRLQAGDYYNRLNIQHGAVYLMPAASGEIMVVETR